MEAIYPTQSGIICLGVHRLCKRFFLRTTSRIRSLYARARRIRLTTEEGGIRMPIKIQTFVVIYLSAIAYNIYAIYMLSNVPIGPVFIYIAPLWNKLPAALRQISDQSGRLDKTSPFAISSQIISFIQDLNRCLFTNL